MRLLFIYHDAPNYHGGPIINALRLLPELVRRGHEVHCLLLYSGYIASNAVALERLGVRCHVRSRDACTQEQVRWILAKVAQLRPNVFVPNLSVSGCYAARWVRTWGIPTVAVIHGVDEFYEGLIAQFVVGESDWMVSGVVCVSKAIASDVASRGNVRSRVATIAAGVPVPDRVSKQEDGIRIVYAGRMVHEAKRVLDLVDALAVAMDGRADIEATLLGNGPLLDSVRVRVRELGLEGRVSVPGAVSEEQLANWMVRHSVVVLLSDHEGTPCAVMDGMAAGLVPVCLDIPGGVRELVIHERTGLLVKDRGKDFAAAIHRLADEPGLRKRLSANARRHIEQGFSLSVTADRWEAFLSELVAAEGLTSKAISLPHGLDLPAVRPGLSREDIRVRPLPVRAVRSLVRAAKRGAHAVRLKWR